jgi:hypothetical protein
VGSLQGAFGVIIVRLLYDLPETFFLLTLLLWLS